MYRKINIYLNGAYLCSTNQAKTCKQAKERIQESQFVEVASVPRAKIYEIKKGDKITAFYAKR